MICNKKEVDTEAENNVNSDLIMKHAIEVNVEPEKFVVFQKTMNKDCEMKVKENIKGSITEYVEVVVKEVNQELLNSKDFEIEIKNETEIYEKHITPTGDRPYQCNHCEMFFFM